MPIITNRINNNKSSAHNDEKYIKLVVFSLLTSITVVFIAVAVISFKWRMVLDSPILMYIALLIDRYQFVPYRDIFDVNMPGTYFIYYLIGKVTNYTDIGFRLADFAFLAGIMVSTFYWLRTISLRVAWSATVVFGLTYLSLGSQTSMAREFTLILPISIAIALVELFPKLSETYKLLGQGVLCGIGFLIKPHSIMFFIAILAYNYYKNRRSDKNISLIMSILWFLLGFMIPNTITLIYLIEKGALPYFYDIIKNYLPLLSEMTGQHVAISGLARVKYLFTGFFSFGTINLDYSLAPWFIPAAIGCFLTYRYSCLKQEQKKVVFLITVLLILACIYPVFQGRFYVFHYLPFLYFVIIATSFCFNEHCEVGKNVKIIAIFIFTLVLITQMRYLPQTIETSNNNPQVAFADNLALFLKYNVREGATVQPLDWVSGVVDALLIDKIPVSTPFIYDLQFHHNVSSPYIQSLRKRFMDGLKKSKPDVIVKADFAKTPHVQGQDTSYIFPELDNFINKEYNMILNVRMKSDPPGKGCFIFKTK